MAGAVSRINGAKGGRPGGSTKKKKSVLDGARIRLMMANEEAPIDVMLNNMLFWYRQAQRVSVKMEKFLEAANAGDEEDRVELLKMLRTLLAARNNAQACAVDAAPYCHPKLASVDHTAGNGTITLQINSIDEQL
jgi:hypothetical protein